jgi:phasin
MAENNPGVKFAEKAAAQVKDASEKMGATVQQSSKMVEDSMASAAKGLNEYNLKALEIARANSMAAFDCAQQLMSAKSPSEMIEIWTAQARKQFEMLTEQTKELTALGQKMTSNATQPLARGMNSPFN